MSVSIDKSYLDRRRQQLAELFPHPVILWSGNVSSRNFPANHYYYRASSHFLYFTDLALPNAAIYLNEGKLILFWNEPHPNSIMWHGQLPTKEDIAQQIYADQVLPYNDLYKYSRDAATIPLSNLETYQQQCAILNRLLPPPDELNDIDRQLAEAIVKLRLIHDPQAITEIQKAIDVSVTAHTQAIKGVTKCQTESQVRSILEGEIIAQQMSCAYNSIVTVNGNVLHNENYSNEFSPSDLLLVDVGAETANGWASDITRTYPVNGVFSPTQKEIYQLVLEVHDRCIDKVAEGVEYKEIHQFGCLTLVEGLVDIGILQGDPEDLFAQNLHTLFFPHGIGHLMGLDVHDMEDIGDVAGYGDRSRSKLFGLKYLRLNRLLRSGMIVTIEPGFYQIPSILENDQLQTKYKGTVNWDKLQFFNDVKGIRIEDDVLVTQTGCKVLSQDLPTTVKDLEELMSV